MTKQSGRIALLVLVLTSLSVDIEQVKASPLEEVRHTRHNLIVPMSEDGNSCTVCHTEAIPWRGVSKEKKGEPPDPANKIVILPPLWDKSPSKNFSYRATQTAPLSEHPYNHPTGGSLVCLSCHDGALGTDMHGINVGNPRVGAAANVPFDGMAGPRGSPPLSRVDHPISILYPRRPDGKFTPLNPTITRSRYWALPDRQGEGLVLPTSNTSSYLDLPKGNLSSPEYLDTLVRTTDGMLECDSCHNPHSEAVRPFLRVPTATLCLVCHDR